jgi:hypothetical protein
MDFLLGRFHAVENVTIALFFHNQSNGYARPSDVGCGFIYLELLLIISAPFRGKIRREGCLSGFVTLCKRAPVSDFAGANR